MTGTNIVPVVSAPAAIRTQDERITPVIDKIDVVRSARSYRMNGELEPDVGLAVAVSVPLLKRAFGHARIRSVTIPRAVLAITLVFAAACGSGCGIVGPSACTLIGCTGLVVEVTGAPGQTPVTVVVTAPDGATRSSTCTSATGNCLVPFPDFTPASVTIRVSTGSQTIEETRQPMYEVTRPNGSECPPECRNARVTVAL